VVNYSFPEHYFILPAMYRGIGMENGMKDKLGNMGKRASAAYFRHIFKDTMYLIR
jgi:hypothetical protein